MEICKRPRNEGLGYDGQTSNEDIKFVKAKTSIKFESSISTSTKNKVQR